LARKRKKLKDLEYGSKEYWNRLLAEDGLSMSAGLNLNKLVYVGDSQALNKIQEGLSQKETGRIPPKDDAE
jgi:hypothetical protein